MATRQPAHEEPSIRDYARVVWRHKWIVVSCCVVLLALGLGYSLTRTPLYQASAQLAYETQLDVSDPLAISGYVDPTQRQSELDGVITMVESPELIDRANRLLGSASVAADYSVSAEVVTAPGQTTSNVVSITAVGPNPAVAARVANQYAEAVTELRRELQVAQVKKAERVVQEKLDSYTSAADRLSAAYATLHQRLSDLQILEATATGNMRLIVRANAPKAPFSPRPFRNALIGAIVGLVLGIGTALVLEQFDTRVRSEDDATAILSLPVLGQIHKRPTKRVQDEPLVVLGDPRSAAAEAFRKLRGNLEFFNVDGDLKSILLTSSLQHEGKSLTACNLALSLSALGDRVVLVDGDLRRPQVHHYLGLRNIAGVSTVLTAKTPLTEALQALPHRLTVAQSTPAGKPPVWTREKALGKVAPTLPADTNSRALESSPAPPSADALTTLRVLTSGPLPPNPGEIVASRSFGQLIEELEHDFDTVIIDAPAMLAVGDAAAMAPWVDGVVLVVDLTTVRGPILASAAKELGHMPCRKLGLVVISRETRLDYANSYYHHATDTD